MNTLLLQTGCGGKPGPVTVPALEWMQTGISILNGIHARDAVVEFVLQKLFGVNSRICIHFYISYYYNCYW